MLRSVISRGQPLAVINLRNERYSFRELADRFYVIGLPEKHLLSASAYDLFGFHKITFTSDDRQLSRLSAPTDD